ncbi:UNVERIFIED_CONTAM: carbamoyl phosphate synthase small subunit [Halobacillus marinus]
MKGYLSLQDGKTFEGKVSGYYQQPVQGEVVFFTGMTGYQEVLTDPSYKGQIVVFTYPLIGNYGINADDGESKEIQVSGVVMFQCADMVTHYKATHSLGEYLEENNVPYLTGVDTRELTKAIRSGGTRQAILADEPVRDFEPLETNQMYEVHGEEIETHGDGPLHIGMIDFGWKKSILKSLLKWNVRVSVIPFTQVEKVNNLHLDGLVLSNGPGDPKDVLPHLSALKEALDTHPSFGICMGHQVIALAYGANTKKLPFGHRGANHPVKDQLTGKVFLSSQNHSYVVDEASLDVTPLTKRFYNVNDGSVEGLMHKEKPVMSVQFHPEANPGPADAQWLFNDFVKVVEKGVNVHV